jgi:prolyl-tRNA editing enzyme YbaK/EbsC (Cys-tRNA(Pro) deacylase)
MANLKQIEAHLKKKKLNYKVINLGGEVYTVEGVTQTGVDGDQIVKTLVVKSNMGFVALAVRGKDRIDFKKVRRLFGSKSELAKPDEVQNVIGVPIGAVCPIIIEVPLYFDQKVMNLKHVNMGSGDLTKGLEIELTDLLTAVGKYTIEDLVLD